jgi:prepilin-type processing-associated H-X9-DG protein
LAIAALNYENSNNTLPTGNYFYISSWDPTFYTYGASVFVNMSQYLEQSGVYNAYNFNLGWEEWGNLTMAGIGISTLWCPSDPGAGSFSLDQADAQGFYGVNAINQSYPSYAGCQGTWTMGVEPNDGLAKFRAFLNTTNGVIYPQSATRISSIPDGTSGTLMFGERAHGIFGGEDAMSFMWWNSGWWGDTFVDTLFPINAYRTLSGQLDLNDPTNPYGGWWWVPLESASSFHPGGANFAFCDGSVHFLKETIASWKNDPNNFGDPIGIVHGSTFGEYQWGKARPQVYQALSTRATREVISSDSY